MTRKTIVSVLCLALVNCAFFPTMTAIAGEPPVLLAGSRMYLALDEQVTSARGGDDVGTIVRCRVWRDVESHGVVLVKAGTPATCRVEQVKRRNMGGSEGKVSVGGVETRATDGQLVMLSGGYHKEGSGHKAVVWTVGLLLLWPILFIPGGNAELPPGTVFDVSTVNDLRLEPTSEVKVPRVVKLNGFGNGLSTEFMLDDFVAQPKQDTFRIRVTKEGALPERLVIDNVNGKSIDPLPLSIKELKSEAGEATGVAEIKAKTLAKFFVKGINRFEVAYDEAGERVSSEVVMDVQM